MLPVRSITNAYFIFNEECFSVIKGEEEMAGWGSGAGKQSERDGGSYHGGV